MKQVDNEVLTAEEALALAEDVEQLVDDADVLTSVTYHSVGGESTNWETGAIVETGGTNVTVNALEAKPKKEDMDRMRIEDAQAVYLILASDLSAITPKVSDYITVASKKRYIVAFRLPMPGVHYTFWVKDAGNG